MKKHIKLALLVLFSQVCTTSAMASTPIPGACKTCSCVGVLVGSSCTITASTSYGTYAQFGRGKCASQTDCDALAKDICDVLHDNGNPAAISAPVSPISPVVIPKVGALH